MISYDKAFDLIVNEISKIIPGTELISLLDSLNRVIAEDVVADIDLPPFNNSAMDGYAFKFNRNNTRNIIGDISAGNFKKYIVNENDAVCITTGSKLPEGADTVIPVEYVKVENNVLCFNENVKLKLGSNVRPKGSDLLKNKVTVAKYTKINPSAVAVLASCGKENVKVFKKLKAGILATGDELIPISEKPEGDKIRASNNYALYSALLSINHLPVSYGCLKDKRNIIKNKIEEILSSDVNLLITTGGVSVGKYDFLKEIFEECGVRKVFWKVNIKPGMPFYFGVYESGNRFVPVFGLPGNPVSTLVNFYIFIEPFIRRLFNQKPKDLYSAVLQNSIKKNDGKKHFSRGTLLQKNEKWEVTAHSSQSSGNYFELGNANCLIITDEDKHNPEKGDLVKCILI